MSFAKCGVDTLYESCLGCTSLCREMAVHCRLRLAFKMQLVSFHTSSAEALASFPISKNHGSDYICGLEQFFITFSSAAMLLSEFLDTLLSVDIMKNVS